MSHDDHEQTKLPLPPILHPPTPTPPPTAAALPARAPASPPGGNGLAAPKPDLFPAKVLQDVVTESARRELLAKLLDMARQESRQKVALEELPFPPSAQRTNHLKQLITAIPGFSGLPRSLQDDIINIAGAYVDLGVKRTGGKLSESASVPAILQAIQRLLLEGKTAPQGADPARSSPEGSPKPDTIFPILNKRF